MDWYRFLPRYWYQNQGTDRCWDKVLNVLLDTHPVSGVGAHTIRLGPATVWVANWPYAYGSAYGGAFPCCGLPKVGTRKRLRAAVEADMISRAHGADIELGRGE
jgi:hypothetical protein